MPLLFCLGNAHCFQPHLSAKNDVSSFLIDEELKHMTQLWGIKIVKAERWAVWIDTSPAPLTKVLSFKCAVYFGMAHCL